MAAEVENCCYGNEEVHEHIARDHPHGDKVHRLRKGRVQIQENPVPVCERGRPEDAPQECVLGADVAVKVPLLIGVVPPFVPVQPLQRLARDPLHRRGEHRAAEKEKYRPPGQLIQRDCHEHGCKTVDKAEGAGGETSVGKPLVFHCPHNRFHSPAYERVDQEKPAKLHQCIFHKETPFQRDPGKAPGHHNMAASGGSSKVGKFTVSLEMT